MNTIVSPTASPSTFSSPKLFKTHAFSSSNIAFPRYSNLKGIGFPCKKGSLTNGVRCNSSIWPGGPGSGDGDSSSRSILDAFFLGKAVAEALNERIESSVGEFLSTVGRLQAEQQKQVQEFQEEVLDRAKKAKEKAAREAMEAQGLVSKSSVETKVTDSGTTRTSYSSTDQAAASQSVDASETYVDASKEEEPPLSSSNDD